MSRPRKADHPHKGWKASARGKHKPLPEPTVNQLEEAMRAFATAKLRYRLIGREGRFTVRVLPAMLVGDAEFAGAKGLPAVTGAIPVSLTYQDHDFATEASARQWREREIIRESIAAGMRARP